VPLRPSAGVQAEWNQSSSEFQPLVVHRGFFFGQDPANPSVHRLGSTYSWSQNPADHAQAEQELIQSLPSYPEAQMPTALRFTMGYRPASGDRKPIVGHHPEFRNHLFFNGLGSKGLLLAPQLADLMADICVHSPREIPPEINIARFYKRFKSSP
jgi:glycine/D-amino acid oxidase-like deaminating enzyme